MDVGPAGSQLIKTPFHSHRPDRYRTLMRERFCGDTLFVCVCVCEYNRSVWFVLYRLCGQNSRWFGWPVVGGRGKGVQTKRGVSCWEITFQSCRRKQRSEVRDCGSEERSRHWNSHNSTRLYGDSRMHSKPNCRRLGVLERSRLGCRRSHEAARDSL